MDDLVAREFDVADLIRRVKNATGDGRISASIAARNAGNVKWAIEALRALLERLREPTSTQVFNAYLKLSPQAAELFHPLWAVEHSRELALVALDCLLCATKQRPDILPKFAVKQHAAALIHVLSQDRKYLARKVFLLLRLCISPDVSNANSNVKVLSNTITRRFGSAVLSDAKYVKSIVQSTVPKIAFLQLVTALLQAKDNDTTRFLAVSSRHCLVAAADIASAVAHESSFNSPEDSAVRPVLNNEGEEPPEKKRKREQAYLRKNALGATRHYMHALTRFLTSSLSRGTSSLLFLVRTAFEPPVIDKIVVMAAVSVPKKKKLSQNEATRLECCELARSILHMVASHEARICRAYHIARALGDVFRDTLAVSTNMAYAHDLLADVLRRAPHLAAEILRQAPFLTFQPSPSSAWLIHATAILTCTRYLHRPSDAFKKFNFFERTLNHNSPLVKHIALLVLAKLCEVCRRNHRHKTHGSDVYPDAHEGILPPLSLFMKTVSKADQNNNNNNNNYAWDESIQGIFATYRKLHPKLFLGVGIDPIKLAVNKAIECENIALANPTIQACLESSKQETLETLFKMKVLSNLVLTKKNNNNSVSLIRDIMLATDLFLSHEDKSNKKMEIALWISHLEECGEECARQFESLVATSWRQPFALFDIAHGRLVSLLTVAAARKVSKALATQKLLPPFEKYLMHVLSALAACDYITGRTDNKHSTVSLFANHNCDPSSSPLLHPMLTYHGNSGNGNFHYDYIQESVQLVRSKTTRGSDSKNSNDNCVLRECAAVGAFLAELYKFRKEKQEQNNNSREALDAIWNAFCARSISITQFNFDERFFTFHATNLRVIDTNSSSPSSYIEKNTICGFLYLLCSQSIDIKTLNLPVLQHEQERAVVKRLSFGTSRKRKRTTTKHNVHSCLHLVADALESVVKERSNLIPLFGDSIHKAISEHRCDIDNEDDDVQALISRILELVFSIIKEAAPDGVVVDEKEKQECARFVLTIFNSFLSHGDSRLRDVFVFEIERKMLQEKENGVNLARLASHAVAPYIALLEKLPPLVKHAAQHVAEMLQHDRAAYKYPARFIPLLAFLASHDQGMDMDIAKISLHSSWKITTNVINTQAAFELGVALAARLKTHDDLIAVSFIDTGPPDDAEAAKIWWAISCGAMSKCTTASAEKIRKLIGIIASQISPSFQQNTVISVHHGPIEFLRYTLPHAQLSKSNSALQRGSTEFEFADNLCTFFTQVFKSCATQLLTAIEGITENDFEDNRNATHSSSSRTEVETRALGELAIVLECAHFVVCIPELGLNLARLALYTFGEHVHVFLSVGRGDQYARFSCAVAEKVLHAFMDITVEATTIVQQVGMDSRSATALTKLEQLFSNPSFCFTAGTSRFDHQVLRAMRNIKRAMQKNDYRRYKGLPDYRSGLFAPLAANVVPQLSSERLNATAKYLMNNNNKNDSNDDGAGGTGTIIQIGPYDAVFVLKTLRLACEYAIYTKEATVVDYNLVVNGGLLRVALYALANQDMEVRVEAYAALDALSRSLGPEFVPNLNIKNDNNNNNMRHVEGGPATLYTYRRPLAFTLQVLRDSIDSPLQQVLPLFASWFWQVTRILLKPNQRAHVPVMRYLLRLPRVDTTDCVGMVHLLRSSDPGTDTKALRMLALDTIDDGLVSQRDHLVAKKRNLYTYILLLAGSELGTDTHIRDKAVKVVGRLPLRLASGAIAAQLVTRHSLAECMVPQMWERAENGNNNTKYGNNRKHMVARIAALGNAAQCLPENFDMAQHGTTLEGALKSNLATMFAENNNKKVDENEKKTLLAAIQAVISRSGGAERFGDEKKWIEGW